MKRAVAIAMVLGLVACSDKATIGSVAASEPPKVMTLPGEPAAPLKPAAEPQKPNPDKALAERVGRAMESAKLYGIDIGVANGVVTLWGTVPSARERTRAGQLAGKVDGVKSVDNKLAVVAGS